MLLTDWNTFSYNSERSVTISFAVSAQCDATSKEVKLKIGEPIPMPDGKTLPEGHVRI